MSNRKALVYSGALVATVSLITTAVLLRRRLHNRHKESNFFANDIDDDAEAFSVPSSRIHAISKEANTSNNASKTSMNKGVANLKQTSVVTQDHISTSDSDSKQSTSIKGQTSSASVNKQKATIDGTIGSSSSNNKSVSVSNTNSSTTDNSANVSKKATSLEQHKAQVQKQQELQELEEEFAAPLKPIATPANADNQDSITTTSTTNTDSKKNATAEDDDTSLFEAAFEEVEQLNTSADTKGSSHQGTSEKDVVTTAAAEEGGMEAQMSEINPSTAESPSVASDMITTSTSSQSIVPIAVSAGDINADTSEFPFEELGVTLHVPAGWEVTREVSPMPNLCMITVSNPSIGVIDSPEAASTVPLIVLTMEDMHAENLNVAEFSERSKQVSIQQMLMMTNGLVRPIIRRDQATSEGPFRRVLEYAQYIPPMFDISVLNLIEVRNGIAYVFQITCKTNLMSEYKPIFLQMARQINIHPVSSHAGSYLSLNTGTVNVRIDSVWSWELPEHVSPNEPLATFHLMSTVKKERMELYSTGQEPNMTSKLRETKQLHGVTIESYFDGHQEHKKFIYGDYTLIVQPLQKAVSYIQEDTLVWVIQSVTPCNDEALPDSAAIFVNEEKDYSFQVASIGQIIASSLNKGTVLYFPHGKQMMENNNNAGSDFMTGANMNMEDRGPVVTIRCATPEDESDCMETLAEWKTRVSTDTTLGNVTNVRETTLRGLPCVSFSATDMQETAPNQRIEMREMAYIFCRDRVSTVIRWECIASQWRKYERELKAFIETFTLPGMEEALM